VSIEGEAGARKSATESFRQRFTTPAALAEAEYPISQCIPRAAILSPFDPLIIDRRRTKRVFALNYQLECYVQEKKRMFGYFALPILFADADEQYSFVGLVDAKTDRGSKLLLVRRLALSPPLATMRRPAAFAKAIAVELCRYADFNGARRVEIERVDCGARLESSLRAALVRELRGLA
ncbi:MAG: crosslink repair DNA glycosylase YcaQ family protein, partial [Bacillota bacterium]|nr:crosslink repair DNA glycosylase YcaQ family protein [Bacillota bacterium]